MSAPWLKFYPADWLSDPLLGTCSLSARGLWIEMICQMHSAVPRGSLARNGRPLSNNELAVLGRCNARDIPKLIGELEQAGVFSRDDDGVIFSRRMRRDIEKAELDRLNGGRGGNPNLGRKRRGQDIGGVNPQDNPSDNGGDKAQKPEARSQKERPSRERTSQDGEGSSTSPREADPRPDPTAWDDDAPFGRDGSAGGSR